MLVRLAAPCWRRHTSCILAGIASGTGAIGEAIGAVLARIAGPVVVANGWWRADAALTGLTGLACVAARSAVRGVGRRVDAGPATTGVASRARWVTRRRRSTTAIRVVRNNLDVARAASDRRDRTCARRQGAAVYSANARSGVTFAPEETETAGEARRAATNERTADADIARRRGFGIETAVTHGVH